MKAWLLTWEGTTGPASCPDKQLIAIFSARYSPKTIEMFADLIYSRSVESAYDMAHFANKRKVRRRQYRYGYSLPTRLFYGQNPCIFARIVSDLRVERDEVRRIEYVRWTEPAYLRVESPGALPVEVEPASEKELIRAINPLSQDIYRLSRNRQNCRRSGDTTVLFA